MSIAMRIRPPDGPIQDHAALMESSMAYRELKRMKIMKLIRR
jgi:hypothetical protein